MFVDYGLNRVSGVKDVMPVLVLISTSRNIWSRRRRRSFSPIYSDTAPPDGLPRLCT